jgi:hypothetical protein
MTGTPKAIVTVTLLALAPFGQAQSPKVPPAITTPDKVETRLGTLEFRDGMPSEDTIDKVYDQLDFTHAFECFVNTFQGVSMAAIHKGFLDIGVKDNEVLVFSTLMDAKSMFLTANADTVYFAGFINLSKGPMVLEPPPNALGTLDDFWWRWVIDFGAPGPDRGLGGKYLLLPPGYDGPVPVSGYFVSRARTTRVLIAAPGYLLFYRDKALLAQRIDLERFVLTGEPITVLSDVQYQPQVKRAIFGVSEQGLLVAQRGSGVALSQLVWHDRKGKELGAVGKPDVYGNVSLSPDGKSVAVSATDVASQNTDVWVYDLHNGSARRLTFDPAADSVPVWSPDALTPALLPSASGGIFAP